MISARWCPAHSLILEERMEGLYCPAGHDWFTQRHPGLDSGPEFWVVDMEFPSGHEQFVIWIVGNGPPVQGAWYAAREAADLVVTVRSEYLERPGHWAYHKRRKRSTLTVIERQYKPRI